MKIGLGKLLFKCKMGKNISIIKYRYGQVLVRNGSHMNMIWVRYERNIGEIGIMHG